MDQNSYVLPDGATPQPMGPDGKPASPGTLKGVGGFGPGYVKPDDYGAPQQQQKKNSGHAGMTPNGE